MNSSVKYAPNVFLAKCAESHLRGEIIPVTTKHGKDNDSVIHNLILEKNGFFYYSITRADGCNLQERAKNKAGKYGDWAESAENKSTEYWERSNKDADFLRLGEPIKVGHHSERRHRKIIEQANTNMGKCVELSNKAKEHEDKADYWAKRANDINLSIPESLEYYEFKLEAAKEHHEGLKSGKYPRSHSYSLTYAKKEVNDLENKVAIAKKLWDNSTSILINHLK